MEAKRTHFSLSFVWAENIAPLHGGGASGLHAPDSASCPDARGL